MRFKFLAAAVTVLPLVFTAGVAQADATLDKLVEMCKKNDDKPDTCECQAKAIVDNADPRVVTVLLAIDAGKTEEEALKEGGLTQEEFGKLMAEADPKITPALEACKA